MKSDLIEKGEVFRKIKVDVPAEAVAAEYERAYARLSKNANLPGFRKGKVPRAILEKQMGPSLQQEVLDGLLPQATFDAVREHALKAVGRPRIDSVDFDGKGPLSFTAHVEVKPEFKLAAGIEGLALSAFSAAVTDTEVDDQVRMLRERAAKPGAALDRPAAKGDQLVVDFEGKVDGQPFAGGSAQGYTLALGRNQLIPGFEEQLEGSKTGDTREVKVTFPADYPAQDVAGKAAVFTVQVKEAHSLELPAADDEFAKTLGTDVKDFAYLKDRLREALTTQKERARRSQLSEAAAAALIEKHSFPVPASLVQAELDGMLQQELAGMQSRGMEVSGGDTGMQSLRQAMQPSAEKRARLALVLEAIADEQKLVVSDADFEAEVTRFAPQLGTNAAGALRWAKENNREHNIRERQREQKALDWVVEKAKISDLTKK